MISKGFKLSFATILVFLGLFIGLLVYQNFGSAPGLVMGMAIFLAFPTAIGIGFCFGKNKNLNTIGKVFLIITSAFYFFLFLFAMTHEFKALSHGAKTIILIVGMLISLITFILSFGKESQKDNEIELSDSQPRIKTLIANILFCSLFSIAVVFALYGLVETANAITVIGSIASVFDITFTTDIIIVALLSVASIWGLIFTIANFQNYKYTNEAYKTYKATSIFCFVCAVIVSLCSFYYIIACSPLFIFIGVITVLGLGTGAVLMMIDLYKVVTTNSIDTPKQEPIPQKVSTSKKISKQPQQTQPQQAEQSSAQTQPAKETFETKLANLFKLKKAGALTDEEFDALKKKLIEKSFK